MGTPGTQLGRIESRTVERRLFPRKRVGHRVSIELPSGKSARLYDIGKGGLSVSDTSDLVPGTITSIRLHIPEINSAIDAIGTVAWSDASGRAGVRFTGIPSEASTGLRQWLEADPSATNSTPRQSTDTVLESRISSLAEISELQAKICSRQLDRDAALDLIVSRMIELTRASGAAIALREGEDVVCRASAGNAPDVGVTLSLSSLSGECFRTGAMVLLSDSETDSRVDPEICRQLTFRSLLVLPITAESEILGIAEVLSPIPRNFEGGDILVLSFLSDLIASIAAPAKENGASASEIPAMLESLIDEAEAIAPPADASQISPASLTAEPQLPTASTTIDEIGLAGCVSESGAPTIGKQDSGLTSAAIAPALIASTHSTPAATSVAESKPRPRALTSEIKRDAVPQFGSQYALSAERRGVPLALGIAAALAVVISAIFFFFYHRSSPTSPRTIAPLPSQTVVPQSASSPLAAPTSAPPVASAPAKNPVKSTSEVLAHRTPEPVKQPAAEAPSELQVIQGESAKRNSTIETAPEAPQISQVGGSLNILSASVVSAKMANPQLQVLQSRGAIEGKLLKKVLPRYPDDARRAGISGDVVISAKIGIDGMLHNLKVISGSQALRGEALAAARQWRYIPAMLSGYPVESETRITISFHHQ